jgi:hypothetical protein
MIRKNLQKITEFYGVSSNLKFGIITPVFDGSIESLDLLHKEMMGQTHKKWIWMLCSNGYSEKISKFIRNKIGLSGRILRYFGKDTCRIIYSYTEYEDTKNSYDLLRNIGVRRDFCIRKIDADYIFMIDADAKILDKKTFQIINNELIKNPKSICMYKVIHKHDGKILPIFPTKYGNIDMLNYCVKASLAKTIGYPTSINKKYPGNDYWYFKQIQESSRDDYTLIDKILFEHNGNNKYECLLDLLAKET